VFCVGLLPPCQTTVHVSDVLGYVSLTITEIALSPFRRLRLSVARQPAIAIQGDPKE